MPDSSARLFLPFLLPAQAQKHVTHNEALARLDLLVQLTVEGFSATTPPALPDAGQIWALGPAPSGDWTGQGNRLAAWVTGGWVFVAPQPGWLAAQGSDLRIWNGADWVIPDQPVLETLPGLGINTSFDLVNRLAVASDATLLTHDGQGHQLKLNKATESDTASLLFQTDWAGRAEMGTTGSDAFEIKVSADGAAWHTALSAAPATGRASFPGGATVSGTLTGTAVTQSASDTTADRLLRVGAGHQQLDATLYRRGNILGTVSQSDGVPTGAILQRGSNANGAFVRFGDGTQMCWFTGVIVTHDHSLSSATRLAGRWTYPAQFVDTGLLSAQMILPITRSSSWIGCSRSNVLQFGGQGLAETTHQVFSVFFSGGVSTTDARIEGTSFFAVGRWF